MQLSAMRRLAGGTILALLAACGGLPAPERALPAPPPTPVFDSLIIPGQRIGPAALGMTGAQLLDALGPPAKSGHAIADVTWLEFSRGISATVRDRDNRVTQLQTTDSRYQTKEGVRVGLSEFEARTRLGSPAGARNDPPLRIVCYPGLVVLADLGSGRVTTLVARPTAISAC